MALVQSRSFTTVRE